MLSSKFLDILGNCLPFWRYSFRKSCHLYLYYPDRALLGLWVSIDGELSFRSHDLFESLGE